MTKRMLIDATHAEETRVAVMDGDRLVEFDYESQSRKPLKGNIFLAKVTRVEPSLQAAFVNFGGNRHAFLPFSEIHPDYFRIPVADREALMAEQEQALRAHDEMEAEEAERDKRAAAESARSGDGGSESEGGDEKSFSENDAEDEEFSDSENASDEPTEIVRTAETFDGADDADHSASAQSREDFAPARNSDDFSAEDSENPQEDLSDSRDDEEGGQPREEGDQDNGRDRGGRHGRRHFGRGRRGGGGRGGRHGGGGGHSHGRAAYRSRSTEMRDDSEEYSPEANFRFNLRRRYKIQEVIKRGQIMLIQVSKEERGNKGAAVSTYLSLPGRYCVLMPNSPRAGGVSRKIASYADRNRMREIMRDLEVPKGMSVILRTAGVSRTKTEIKRDLDYLIRLWNNIRELTLQSTAPAVVYEEADLIKRAVRDLYTRDVEEIVVSGEEGYKTAKDFMKMMIPSHIKRVKQYKDEDLPLFTAFKAESQITEIGEARVTLPSGGYLIISPTEALVSIDVNSGKATKERNIEETALRTNLEAASEVARQLRLRDLGGLVVVDFIDMEDRRNNAKVERRIRDALSIDRARIQVGRISSFGLLELSRQRLNPSLAESQFETCPHCEGVGRIRSVDGTSIMVLRALEEEGLRKRAAQVVVHVCNAVALYILNNKRRNLLSIETRHGFEVLIRSDADINPSDFRLEVVRPIRAAEPSESGNNADDDMDESEEGQSENQPAERRSSERHTERRNEDQQPGEGDGEGRRRGRRGNRRRGGRGRDRDRGERREPSEHSTGDNGNIRPDDVNEDELDSMVNGNVAVDDDIDPDAAPGNDTRAPRRPGGRQPRGGRNPRRPASSRPAEQADLVESAPSAPEPATDTKPARAPRAPKKPPAEGGKKGRAPAAASNDDSSVAEPPPVRNYEVVNEDTGQKKKGWWNRLIE